MNTVSKIFTQKRILWLIKLAIALLVMGVLVRNVNSREILNAFKNPQYPVYIIIAGLLLIPNMFIQWYRWHFLLKLIQQDIRPIESIQSFFGGVAVGFVTPGRLGEFGRPFFLQSIDRMQGMGMVLIDKIYAFLTIFIGGSWGLIALVSYYFRYNLFLMMPLVLIGLLITIFGTILMVNPFPLRSFLYHLSVMLPARDKLKQIIECMDRIKKTEAIHFTVYSWFFYGVYILQFCLLAFAFQQIAFTTALTATTSTMFTKTLIPVSFADLGVREGASIFFFLRFQVDKVTAFNSALLLFVINIVIPTIVGLFFLPKMSLTLNHKKSDPS
ncbi:flippase-like domain-containing protein [candidate division KSB1 bacterium]|nr:flippase-like domain-containing protein [candidate division KSB1 bacterium]